MEQFELNLVRAIQNALGGNQGFWLGLTQLGSDYAFIVLMGLYIFLVNPRGARDFGLWFSISLFVNGVLKTVLGFDRPFVADPALASDAARATAGGPGMPSGHAQISTTIWGLTALALKSRAFTAFAIVIVSLVSLSRVVLGVHYVSDVLLGLGLGLGVIALAARVRFPNPEGALRVAVPVVAYTLATFLTDVAYVPMSMGLLTGFWLTRSAFAPHPSVAGRVIGTVGGLVLVFVAYFAFRVIPDEIRSLGIVEALRYTVLVLIATEGVPRLLRLPRATPTVTATS